MTLLIHCYTYPLVRTDETAKTDNTTISKQLRNFGDTSNILLPVLRWEAKVSVEASTNVVSIETVGWDTMDYEVLL
jgi:hypothetical protein